MLERRNATAYRILALVSQDMQQHAAVASAIADGGVMAPNPHAGKGGMILKALKGKKKLPGISGGAKLAMGMAFGATLLMLMLGKFFSADDPLDPDAPKKSFIEKAKDFFTKKDEQAEDTVTPVSPGTVDSSISTSPLLAGESLVPYKTAKSTAAIRSAISSGSEKAGADHKLMYAIAGAESSFRSNVGASTSSAQGLYQFTKGTWEYLMKLYPKLGYTLEDRNDPEKASYVASLYVNSIMKTLTRTLGRKPSYGETYLGYFLGPTGASNFLVALRDNPKAIGAEMFPKAASANKNVFYDGSKALSLAQILAKLEGKIVSYAGEADGDKKPGQGSATSTPSPAVAAPAKTPGADSASNQGVTGLPPVNAAQSKPVSPSVSLPSAEVTNKRKAGAQAANDAKVNQAPAAGPTSGVTTKPKSQSNDQPLRGRDGRLYKIS